MSQAGIGFVANIPTALREEGGLDSELNGQIFTIDQPGLCLEDTPGVEAP